MNTILSWIVLALLTAETFALVLLRVFDRIQLPCPAGMFPACLGFMMIKYIGDVGITCMCAIIAVIFTIPIFSPLWRTDPSDCGADTTEKTAKKALKPMGKDDEE